MPIATESTGEDSPFGGYNYQIKGQNHIMEFALRAAILCIPITGSDTGVNAFLKSIPGARRLRNIKRKLLLWRTGVIPENHRSIKDVTQGLSPLETSCKKSGITTPLTEIYKEQH